MTPVRPTAPFEFTIENEAPAGGVVPRMPSLLVMDGETPVSDSVRALSSRDETDTSVHGEVSDVRESNFTALASPIFDTSL